MEQQEQRLIDLAQRGDVDAFNDLVRLYEGRVYTLCVRMLGDADAAADVAQETFISAYKNLHRFRGGLFRAWILRIATNGCYDLLRARKRRPAVSLDAPAMPPKPPGRSSIRPILASRRLMQHFVRSLGMRSHAQLLIFPKTNGLS